MRVAPGSHRTLGAHWDLMKEMWSRGEPLPEGGLPGAEPRLGEVDLSSIAALEPRPVVAKRGEALVFTQSLVHAGWHNSDSQPRKAIYCTWIAAEAVNGIGGLATEAGEGGIDEVRSIHPRIRWLLPADRQHIVITTEQLEEAVAGWREQWPPTLRHRFRL